MEDTVDKITDAIGRFKSLIHAKSKAGRKQHLIEMVDELDALWTDFLANGDKSDYREAEE